MKIIIYTIGHSTKSIEEFIGKLKQFQIDTVIDVRSTPYSKWTHQFNRNALSDSLLKKHINYLYRGNNLGGLKENIDFEKTVLEVVKLSKTNNLVLMCSEKDYKKCHRFLILTPTLERHGITIEHITWDDDSLRTISLF